MKGGQILGYDMDVPSCAILRISRAYLASEHVLINPNMFSSTLLKITFKALEFPGASSSSASVHSVPGFKLVVQSSEQTIGCFDPYIITCNALLPMNLRKTTIKAFQ